MDESTPHHGWPEEGAVPDDGPAPARGMLARLGRILGDVLLTAGIGNGLASTRTVNDRNAMTNVILFEEGRSKVRQARRTSHRN